MTNKEALEILEQHQLWRRGLPPYDGIGKDPSFDVRELGVALYIAIKTLKENKK